jgi:hypothetical protein
MQQSCGVHGVELRSQTQSGSSTSFPLLWALAHEYGKAPLADLNATQRSRGQQRRNFGPLVKSDFIRGGIDELFFQWWKKTTSNGPAPQRLLRGTQATRGIACPKPSEEPQVSTFVARGSLCALRRHLLAGQVFFESKNLTANPFKSSFERRIEALF